MVFSGWSGVIEGLKTSGICVIDVNSCSIFSGYLFKSDIVTEAVAIINTNIQFNMQNPFMPEQNITPNKPIQPMFLPFSPDIFFLNPNIFLHYQISRLQYYQLFYSYKKIDGLVDFIDVLNAAYGVDFVFVLRVYRPILKSWVLVSVPIKYCAN